jgi:hypothetical protein
MFDNVNMFLTTDWKHATFDQFNLKIEMQFELKQKLDVTVDNHNTNKYVDWTLKE